MAKKKSDIYKSLWDSCDKLRGSMDASQYKNYILILLFVKYISDKKKVNSMDEITIPEGASFDDIKSFRSLKNIGEKLNIAIDNIASQNDLHGIIKDTDFNDTSKFGNGQAMVDKITGLIDIFDRDELDFTKNTAQGDDILGDAYEYLMRHFATESGKSKGQFYTPSEVSRIMAKIINMEQAVSKSFTAYDPTCGSGSLLLKVADEALRTISLYGQEKDNATCNLAKMNMILHNNTIAVIEQGDTLSHPLFIGNNNTSLKTFDRVVANPPFSTKSWQDGFNPSTDTYDRFQDYAIPPEKNGDYAFFLHILKSLNDKGKGAVILPHGVLFRGGTEQTIRTKIIKEGFIKGIISLPTNLFYGTGIPACIIVIDKEHASTRKGIFMIDASNDFIKDGNKNRLRERDIHKIVDIFNNQTELEFYSRFVTLEEIKNNEYNLNIPRYINSKNNNVTHDLEGHLKGGIPQADIDSLHQYWELCPSLKDQIFETIRANYYQLKIDKNMIRKTILDNTEFQTFTDSFKNLFNILQTKWTKDLKTYNHNTQPKQVALSLSEEILHHFQSIPHIDSYGIYQHFMNYWNETMQDDLYLITVRSRKIEWTDKLNDNGKSIGKICDLLEDHYIINRYFPADQQPIDKLFTIIDTLEQKKAELEENHSGEEGILENITPNKDILSKKITALNKKEKLSASDKENLSVYETLLSYINDIKTNTSKANKLTKDLKNKLITESLKFTEDEIKVLVVTDKWLPTLNDLIMSELDNLEQYFTQQVSAISDRYDTSLPSLEKEISTLSQTVQDHLNTLGFGDLHG